MITKINLTNFKSFESLNIDMAPITLLTGLNSSGKSSVIQAARIAHDARLLEGYGECVSFFAEDAGVCIEQNRKKYEVKIKKGNGAAAGLHHTPDQDIHYISADRLGPQKVLHYKPKDVNYVGERGENVLSYIGKYYDAGGVPEKLRMEGFDTFSGVKQQIRFWLNIISPSFDFDFKFETENETAFSVYTKNRFMAKDVGFGLSYALPIIADVIISSALFNAGSVPPVIIIENPEAHLHPSGQTKLGRFLALAASCGIQVIAETHSDHFLNGVRLAVKNRDISQDDVIIHYFQYDVKEEKSGHTEIYINEKGMLDEWPEGFFDETEKNLLELL
jgi:predicted ATPase